MDSPRSLYFGHQAPTRRARLRLHQGFVCRRFPLSATLLRDSFHRLYRGEVTCVFFVSSKSLSICTSRALSIGKDWASRRFWDILFPGVRRLRRLPLPAATGFPRCDFHCSTLPTGIVSYCGAFASRNSGIYPPMPSGAIQGLALCPPLASPYFRLDKPTQSFLRNGSVRSGAFRGSLAHRPSGEAPPQGYPLKTGEHGGVSLCSCDVNSLPSGYAPSKSFSTSPPLSRLNDMFQDPGPNQASRSFAT